MPTAPKTRNDIELLRAISVLLVVGYHYFPSLVPGGYIGVDVFFVISGYLVTLSLISRTHLHTMPIQWLAEFWARRARRLLPNALVVMLVSLVVGLFFLPDLMVVRLSADVIASAGYVVNLIYASRAVDYGDTADFLPLMNFWSLAVEEQFYATWALVLTLAWTLSRGAAFPTRLAGLVAVALLIASFGYCLSFGDTRSPIGFFSLTARGWELLVGAGVAIRTSLNRGQPVLPPWLATLLFGTIVFCGFAFSHDTLHPGPLTTIPVIACAAIIGLNSQQGTFIERITNLRSVLYIGNRSYSIYLWHWPVLALGSVVLGGDALHLAQLLVLLGVTLFCAEVAYRYIESPFRWTIRVRAAARSILTVAVMASALVLILALFVRVIGQQGVRKEVRDWVGFPQTPTLISDERLVRADMPVVEVNGCHLSISEREPGKCEFGVPWARSSIVLFGDSHAAHWFPGIELLALRAGYRLVVHTKSGCPPGDVRVWTRFGREYTECAEWRDRVLASIGESKPEFVFVSSLVSNSPGVLSRDTGRRLSSDQATDAWINGSVNTLGRLKATGSTVIVLRDIPLPRVDVITCLSREQLQGACGRPLSIAMRPAHDVTAALLAGVDVWDFTSNICPNSYCNPITDDGVSKYRDSNHLSATFARFLGTDLLVRLRESRAAKNGL